MAVQAQQYPDNIFFPSQELMEFGGLHDMYQSLLHLQQSPSPYPPNHLLPMAISHSLAVQVEKQRQEIDRFIILQSERLRVALQEQRKQQMMVFMKRLEAKTLLLLRQKEEAIAKAYRKTEELEDYLRRIEAENQTWQRIARENEALVITLNNAIEQMMQENVCFFSGSVEDAESCCDSSYQCNPFQREESREELEKKKMVCKTCGSRDSSVLILPCRHLCCCKECNSLLDSCPVCKSVKKASIEVHML